MRGIWNVLGLIVLGIGVLAAVIYGGIYFFTQIGMDTAERRGQADEIENVRADGERRVAIVEEFYDLCSTVEAQDDKLDTYNDQLEIATSDQERSRIQSGILAIENTRSENIAEYNSKADNTRTRGFLREDGLPAEIDPDEEVDCDTGQSVKDRVDMGMEVG